jgi:hypothetical protein
LRFASEVLELLGAYPGRDFRMAEIVRYIVGARPDLRTRRAAREAVRLVLRHLVDAGPVEVTPAKGRGGFAIYRWKEPEDARQVTRA